MDRVNRLVGIVLLLQSRRLVRAEDIAEHFGISVRTVYRDIKALDEAGVPIAAEAGVGYSLADGYHLPPVMFTREEASALFVGGEFVQRLTDESLQGSARSALLKIRAVLSPDGRDFIERLQNATAVYIRPVLPSDTYHAHLATLQSAVAGRRVVRLAYSGIHRDEITLRDVEPLGLVYYADRWHLIGYCRLRLAIRDFRTDRIQEIELLADTFPEHNGFSLKRHVERMQDRGPTQEVRIRLTRDAARYTSNRHFFGFVEESAVSDGVEMLFYVPSLHWISGWVLSFGPSAHVLYPEELRQIVCTMAHQITEQYESVAALL